MKKKLLSLMLVFVMVLACTMTVFAANDVPVLTLEKNQYNYPYNSDMERHIKVSWTKVYGSGTYQVQIDDNMNFESPIIKRTANTYWNFVFSENADLTYYLRVKKMNGEWSNVVTAEPDNIIKSEVNPYFKVPTLPKIPDITNSIKITPKIIVPKIKIPVPKIE